MNFINSGRKWLQHRQTYQTYLTLGIVEEPRGSRRGLAEGCGGTASMRLLRL